MSRFPADPGTPNSPLFLYFASPAGCVIRFVSFFHTKIFNRLVTLELLLITTVVNKDAQLSLTTQCDACTNVALFVYCFIRTTQIVIRVNY